MDQKIKLLFFIKISAFILISWMWNLSNEMSIFKKSLGMKCNPGKKSDAVEYRILTKYKQDKDSCDVCLKEYIPNCGSNENKDISINGKWAKTNNKLSNIDSSKSAKDHKQIMKYKSCIFESKKYSHMEKKIFKELDLEYFLKNNRTISDKTYKKIILKKYRLRFAFPLLLFLLLFLSLMLDSFMNLGLMRGLYSILNLYAGEGWSNPLRKVLSDERFKWLFESMEKVTIEKKGFTKIVTHVYIPSFFRLIIYVIPFIIFGVTLISGTIYYHKKVKKYEKIKFKKR
ncbi:fam-l protein [Plasmodium brasilianum]|uniref:Fam-l protein n=1 Tax=Plasmodium brasilianum TaxID=5824 RepID=A0ACB9YDM3_PLABR|nr:fam-l protein [Plasmodium brasilianum]